MNSEETEIANEINKQFAAGVRKWMDSEQEKRSKEHLHVSSFVYSCVRKVWYETKYYDLVPPPDLEGTYRMWIGTKLHETPITDTHELPLFVESNDMKFGGRLDEIVEYNGKKIIVDKKFVSHIPSSPNDHYMNQIMFYAALLKMMKGVIVDGVALHYFVPHVRYERDLREFTFVRLVSKDEIEAIEALIDEMMKKLKISLEQNVLPEKHVSWYCKYCPFKVSCDMESLDYLNGEN